MATTRLEGNEESATGESAPRPRRRSLFDTALTIAISLVVLQLVMLRMTSLGSDVLWVGPLIGVVLWTGHKIGREVETNHRISD